MKESYSSLLHPAARSKPGVSGTELPEIWTETTLVDFLPGYSLRTRDLYFEFNTDSDLTQLIYINYLIVGI